jgi:hypothetical protein
MSRSVPGFLAGLCLSLVLGAAAPAAGAAEAAPGVIDGIAQMPPEQLEQRLPDAYPINYYIVAEKLFENGDKAKALQWVYVGELRYHFLLTATPDAAPGGPELFKKLQGTVGQRIILSAGSEPALWGKQIDAALAWDAAHPNGVTSKSTYPAQLQQARAPLEKLRDTILARVPAAPPPK